MRTTIFNTPLLTPLLRALAIMILKLAGWRTVGEESEATKCVLIGAPHTSNWDFPLMLMAVLKLRLEVFWMGKNSLFKFPFQHLMLWLGGIPIDRSKANNVVQLVVDQYHVNDKLIVLIPPEGTRSRVANWKTGFYHIANKAGVPILMGYIDAPKKELGLADYFETSGDIEHDMQAIRDWYKDKGGIRPENV